MAEHLFVHAGCAALVAIDLLVRSWRLRWLTIGAGHPLSGLDALRANLLADAGAVLSPMRLGGEPARIAGMALARVPAPAACVALGWEVVTGWTTTIAITAALTTLVAPAWWTTSAPLLAERRDLAVPVLLLLLAFVAVTVVAARRLRGMIPPHWSTTLAQLHDSWRGMPRSVLAASVALSATSMLSRTAILPVLILALQDAPPVAALWLGSYILVYGQLLFPTPAGLGAVELGFLAGAAGDLGGGISLLVAWRWWVTGLPVVLGLGALWASRHRIYAKGVTGDGRRASRMDTLNVVRMTARPPHGDDQ